MFRLFAYYFFLARYPRTRLTSSQGLRPCLRGASVRDCGARKHLDNLRNTLSGNGGHEIGFNIYWNYPRGYLNIKRKEMKIMSCEEHGEKQDGKFCDECGAKLVKSQSDKVKKSKAPYVMSGESPCPGCGFALDHKHQEYCPGCSHKLTWTCR